VSKKTIYARYPSKDALLIGVVTDLVSRLHERVVTAMGMSEGDPRHMLTSFGTQVARTWSHPEEIGLYRLIVSEATRFPQLASIYRDGMRRFRTTLADYLSQQSELGTLTIPDPDAASHQFGMLVYGEIREDALLGDTITDDDIASVVERSVHVFSPATPTHDLRSCASTNPVVSQPDRCQRLRSRRARDCVVSAATFRRPRHRRHR
jgi:AcrR family transcriptional regulator